MTLADYLASGGPARPSRVLPPERPDPGLLRGRVALEPLFRPFEMERARALLATEDVSRSRTLAVVREAILRDDEWFTDGAIGLAEVAARTSLLQMGGADGLDADTGDAGLQRVVSALSRFFTNGREDKARASNVVALSAVALTRRGLSATAALRELARVRRAQGLAETSGDRRGYHVAVMATLAAPVGGAMVDALAPVAAEVVEARDRVAAIDEREAAAADAATLAEAERRELQRRVADLEGVVESQEAQARDLAGELKSLRVIAGHQVHSAEGAFAAFVGGPINTLVEDALTLVEEGPDHLSAVREKLEDMQDELRRAAQ